MQYPFWVFLRKDEEKKTPSGCETSPLKEKVTKQNFKLLQYTEKGTKLMKVTAIIVPKGSHTLKSWGGGGRKTGFFFLMVTIKN